MAGEEGNKKEINKINVDPCVCRNTNAWIFYSFYMLLVCVIYAYVHTRHGVSEIWYLPPPIPVHTK